MAQVHGGDEGVVLDAHLVMVLVFLLQATEYGDALGWRRFVYHHLLETALQGLVLFEVFLVFVQGGAAYGAQLASGQGRLEDVAGVHGSGTSAGTHEGVDFIDEEDDFALALHDFLNHALEALLELTLVFCACDEGAHVQGEEPFALEVLGHLPVHYLGGQSLCNGGLTHAGFAHQDGVVLRAPRKNLQHAADLVVTAYHRVQLPLGSRTSEVYGVFA